MSGLRLRPVGLTVPCPVCGSAIHTTYGQVIKEVTVLCPKGHSVKLVDQHDGMRKLDRSFDEFNRSLRRLGRRR